MKEVLAVIGIVAIVAGTIMFIVANTHQVEIEAIKAGLQQCPTPMSGSVWQKECEKK